MTANIFDSLGYRIKILTIMKAMTLDFQEGNEYAPLFDPAVFKIMLNISIVQT
jgi:hypothetical protein